MNGLRIAIVEDEVLTIESISIYLERMGHEVVGAFGRYETVFSNMPDPLPDLFLLDIRLKGKKTGLDVAQKLNSLSPVPFLFLTSNVDSDMVRFAMDTLPAGYITKPFSFEDLFIGIELARTKLNPKVDKARKIEVKTGNKTEWLRPGLIHFLEASRSYVTIHLEGETRVLRQSLGGFLDEFEPGEMVRIHRSYAVNPHKVNSIGTNKVVAGGHKLPLGPGYRANFLESMRNLNV